MCTAIPNLGQQKSDYNSQATGSKIHAKLMLTNIKRFTLVILRKSVSCSCSCFGLNGPLKQYFSLYWAISQRRRKKREVIDEGKKIQTTPFRTYCKRSRPLPHYYPNQYDAPALEVYQAPSHQPTTTNINAFGKIIC